uniref:FYVE-type domain-containing protein n=1 Tax=Phytophthora fragariae TaxID=53985 RepID=A0A6A3E149_9STRA|nr:hypothetical protein PF009_g22187 [Phytophthora fragariae]
MPTQTFSHLLKPLQCTQQDDNKLRELAETLVVHNIEQYSSLKLTKNGAPVSKTRWKQVYKKESTKVFKDRATKSEPLEMPSLMLLGTVVGKLEDFMYAVVAPSTEAMRIKSTLIKDGVVDCKLLHNVARPTMDDPFHHISVKWCMFSEPEFRDHVFLDSTGIASTTTGERIGYHLTHSIGFDQIPNFTSCDVARCNMSVCSLYVQNTPSTVKIYVRGFFDFQQEGKYELINNATLNTIAAQWMLFPRQVECEDAKKLLWAIHKNNSRESTTKEGKSKLPMAPPTPGLCKVCSKSFGFLGTSRKFCQACNEQICSRCSVMKSAVTLALDQVTVVEKKRVFSSSSQCDLAHNVPQLHLSESDVTSLRELAETLVNHNIESYNALQVTSDGQADARQWKELRRKDGIRVFKERSAASGPTLPCIPSLLLLGTVVGKLEDVMFVAAAATDEQMKLTSKCLQDGVVDSKVVQSVVTPSEEQPFRHVGVKWRLHDNARDYVSVDATGFALSCKGERLGYSVSHSVAFSQIPSFDKFGVERANMSVCCLFHQKTPETVQCYARGFFDFRNELLNNLSINALATQWLRISRYVECAEMKKLVWRLRNDSGLPANGPMMIEPAEQRALEISRTDKSQDKGDSTAGCAVCQRSLGFSTCKICRCSVCSGCSVKKLVCVLAPDCRTMLDKKRTFCTACVCQVAKSAALAIAKDEIHERQPQDDESDAH